MSVVAWPNISPQGTGPLAEWELRSNTAASASPITGATRTLERAAARWAVTMRYSNLVTQYAAMLKAAIASLRGRAQRVYLRDFAYTRRGSFAASELLTNFDFANGTTGWSVQNATLIASDGILRVIVEAPAFNAGATQAITLTSYAPHAGRGLVMQGSPRIINGGVFIADSGSVVFSSHITGFGLKTVAIVPLASPGSFFPAYAPDATGYMGGDHIFAGYASVARCALVDNGPNSLLRSDEIDNAAWTKNDTTVTTNHFVDPLGTTTAERVIENTANAEHYVLQSISRVNEAGDWMFAVALRRGDAANLRDRAQLRIFDSGSTNGISAMFDLTAGVISTAASANGAATNPRGFMVALGGNWYYCCIVGRMPASDTTIRTVVNLVSNPSTTVYTGDGSSNIGMWRATLAKISVPSRLSQTTTAATAGTSQTGGSLYLRGLPVSTNGLLLKDDMAEIITPSASQLVRVRAALNSDAAGLGYLEFEPPLRESPADNAAVIVEKPMGRFLLDADSVRWSDSPGGFTDLEATFVEDIVP